MAKDRDRWRRALNDCTPGGSEFAGDPAYCQKYITERKHSLWETAKKNFITARDLRTALEDAVKTLRLIRDGAEGPEIRTLARDLINKLEELNVGRGKQAPEGPGPEEAPFNIARKESD
jgi:hypothetical protein